jgi:FAD/FMN-containing dehydrogenase
MLTQTKEASVHPNFDGRLDEAVVQELRPRFRGELLRPTDDRYDEARKIYNAMIDKHPALIAQCVDVADVVTAVNFALDNNLLLAIRSGGHNGPGLGTCDGGLVIDLSPMKGIYVDPAARTVRVEGGCTWGDVDHATHAFGLAVPSGIISTTGVGGLTLGGGHGYLTRKYGLTIDNLLAADMVLADGRLVTASAKKNEDLFWAIRGGGGNFGVVTSFLFQAHPVSTVYAGPMMWPLEQATPLLKWYRKFIAEAPEDMYAWFGFGIVPPAPPFPPHLHNQKVCIILWCYTGALDRAEEFFQPIRELEPPVLDMVGPLPYPALQSMFDALYPPGMQWYWKGDFVRELSDEAIALHVKYASTLPSIHSTMHLYPINGMVHRVGSQEMAWSYRDVTWSSVIVGVDPDPATHERTITWAKNYWEALHPYSAGGAYSNFMMEEGQARVQATYQNNYERLTLIKQKYDPANLFRVNQNIKPAK